MCGMPVELLAPLEQFGAELLVAATVGDVPLAGRHDLERLVALLEELDRMRDGSRLADESARRRQDLDRPLLGGVARRTGEQGVVRAAAIGGDPLGHVGQDAAVPADDGAGRQLQLTPPDDVGEVAERADHGNARALLGISQAVGDDRDLDIEAGRPDSRSEERLVALVIRVRDERDAGGEQFRTRGLNENDGVGIGRGREADSVVGAGPFAVFELGLGDGGAEGDIPEGGRLALVSLAACEVAQEGELAHALRVGIDGLVGLRPVDGEAHAAPELLEDDLVLNGEALAEFDEVLAGDRDLLLGIRIDRRFEGRVVREAGVAADAVVVLHAALGRQAVVVPAHRVENLEAAHALVAGDAVGVRVREHVPDMQGAADRRRGSVDRVDVGADLGAIEAVGALLLPYPGPRGLDAIEGGLVGQAVGTHGPQSYLRCCRTRLSGGLWGLLGVVGPPETATQRRGVGGASP